MEQIHSTRRNHYIKDKRAKLSFSSSNTHLCTYFITFYSLMNALYITRDLVDIQIHWKTHLCGLCHTCVGFYLTSSILSAEVLLLNRIILSVILFRTLLCFALFVCVNLCLSLTQHAQIIRMSQWWWARWMWTPLLELWSFISGSFQSRSSPTSCIPTSLEASVSCCIFTFRIILCL